MPSNIFLNQVETTAQQEATNYLAEFIMVLQLHDGRFVISAHDKPYRLCAAINSGMTKEVPQALQVNRVVAVKEQNESRTLISTVRKFVDHYGEDKVLVI